MIVVAAARQPPLQAVVLGRRRYKSGMDGACATPPLFFQGSEDELYYLH